MPRSQEVFQARGFLNRYRQSYQREKSFILRNMDGVLARKRKPKNEVPAPPLEGRNGKTEVCKWFSHDSSGIVGFYDDGADLPEDFDIVVVSQSFSVASAEGIDVKSQSWVLKRI